MSKAAQPKATGRLLSATKWQIGNRTLEMRWLVGALLFCSLSVVAATKPLQLEPTVSSKEAVLLEAAASTTNRLEAVAMLQTKALPQASAALDFAIANFQFQEGKLEAAAQSYSNAIAKLPTFRNARKNLGRVFLMLDRNAEAIRVYQTLVEEGLMDADTLLLLGHGLMQQEHFVSAENAYRQVMLLAPDHADVQQGLVNCLLQQERYREARSLLKSVLRRDVHRESLWSLLANVNIALDATDDAIEALETARRLGQCSSEMLGLLGDLYLNSGQPVDAVERYEAALAAGWGDSARLQRAIEGFILVGNASGAVRILDKLETANANPAQALNLIKFRAELTALQGQTVDAIASFRKVVSQNPLDGNAMLRLGSLLQETGDLGGAELAYERAGRLEGMASESLVRRAQLAVQRNRFSAAVELLEAAQAIDPKPHAARYLEQIRRLAEQ